MSTLSVLDRNISGQMSGPRLSSNGGLTLGITQYIICLLIGSILANSLDPSQKLCWEELSKIRKNKLCFAPPVYVRLVLPPWILKWTGLESSGQRLISLNSKTKKDTFFSFFFKTKNSQRFQN